jgi:hypothetical protein
MSRLLVGDSLGRRIQSRAIGEMSYQAGFYRGKVEKRAENWAPVSRGMNKEEWDLGNWQQRFKHRSQARRVCYKFLFFLSFCCVASSSSASLPTSYEKVPVTCLALPPLCPNSKGMFAMTGNHGIHIA